MRRRSTRTRSRRSFLRGCGLTLAGFGLTSLFPEPLIRQAMAATTAPGKRLLFVFLRGGNDGINAVIPHGDPDYSAVNRPTLYLPPAEAIDLNGFASLHPGLQDLVDPYNAGELAVLHRIGYANSSRSHFDGQRFWENGDPTSPELFQGWLYRYIQESALSAGADLPVLTSQALPPLLVGGAERFVNVSNPANFNYVTVDPYRSKLADAWRGQYTGFDGLEPYRPLLSQTGVKLADTIDEYESWDQAGWNPIDPDTGWSLFPVDFDTNPDDVNSPTGKKFSGESYAFFNALKVAALSLVEADATNTNGTRIAGTQLGGWDLHNNQGQSNGRQGELLSWLAYGMRSLRILFSGAATDPRNYAAIWNDTVVVTLSEFGRTSRENASAGTDHAAASCLFVEGGGVNGGVYNCDATTWPAGSMFGVDGRYLLERTDYRAVFWELLRDHMGAAPASVETVFPGYTAAGLGGQELGLIGA